MHLFVIAGAAQKKELETKGVATGIIVHYVSEIAAISNDAAAVIDLQFENTADRIYALKKFFPKPVVINAVNNTLLELGEPFIRINAWPGFLSKPVLEMVAAGERVMVADQLFKSLGWQYQLAPDITGMISPRIIAALVNEAWITYDDGISSREEIDIAMKLGTNYPYGPFEWGNIIGLTNIKSLVMKLQKEKTGYNIAPSLKKY